jgi:hypothetical protein
MKTLLTALAAVAISATLTLAVVAQTKPRDEGCNGSSNCTKPQCTGLNC